MNPMYKFNGTFCTDFRGRTFDPLGCGPQVIPQMIVVTGHQGFGGNLGVNGIYERYPDDFQGHPVYMKKMEKRAEEDEASLPKAGRKPSRKTSRPGDSRKPSRPENAITTTK